jgi:hypothetical protein
MSITYAYQWKRGAAMQIKQQDAVNKANERQMAAQQRGNGGLV